jgi:HAD superfamily hydrolase (TIGR01484 family)
MKDKDNTIKLLATDALGTLIHPRSSSGESIDDLMDVGQGRRMVHKETRELLQRLKDCGVLIVIVSGMRQDSYQHIGSNVTHDYAVIEDGSLFYSVAKDGSLVRDKDWDEKLYAELEVLRTFKGELVDNGLVLDDIGREGSFRVDPLANEYQNLPALVAAYGELEDHPNELRRTEHSPYPPDHHCYQFVPRSSGKRNALRFLMERLGIEPTEIAAFGDDLNDEETMAMAAYPMTLAGAHNDIQKLVIEHEQGIFAQAYSHQGTISALKQLIDIVELK